MLVFLALSTNNAPLAIRYPPDIRPRPLPGLIFSNIRPRSVTNWISTCGLNRFATCSLRSAECHRVKPTANLVCVISEVTGAQLVTAAQHTTEGWFSIIKETKYMWRLLVGEVISCTKKWFLTFFYVALACLLEPRCRFLINIARGSVEVNVLLFYGHMIKHSFHTCSLWKGRKVNK